MNSGWFNIKFPFWSRDRSGDSFYDLKALGDWYSWEGNLRVAQNHPILTPALLFVSKLYSQARFKVRNVHSGKEAPNHPILRLLQRPNFYQTLPDMLESLLFMQMATGVGVLYINKVFGTEVPNALYVLDSTKISYPDSLNKDYMLNRKNAKRSLNEYVIYDDSGINKRIKLKDLLFFYDMPNGFDPKNPFKVRSRICGLKQTLINTNDSLVAKNIILKSNGKELFSGSKEGLPLTPEEKEKIENSFNVSYGLGRDKRRGIVTRSNVNWRSLHIALRDLGLDESVKVDGNMIYTALHIPKDILSLEAKKTTYNNFKESMTSYIQNEMQSTLNSAITVFAYLMDDDHELIGDYDHMPVMQHVMFDKFKAIKEKAAAIRGLREAGVPDELVIEMCSLPKNTILNELIKSANNEEGQEEQGEEQSESEGAEDSDED